MTYTPSGPVSPQLMELYEQVGQDAGIVGRFVSDYLCLLDQRIHNIRARLAAGDEEDLVIALLSLETTSVMIAASGVARAARALRLAVGQHAGSVLPGLVDVLAEEAAAVRAQLEQQGYAAGVPPEAEDDRDTASR